MSEHTELTESVVENMLRFEPAAAQTCDGKFNFLLAQEKHLLVPRVEVTLSAGRLDSKHPGY